MVVAKPDKDRGHVVSPQGASKKMLLAGFMLCSTKATKHQARVRRLRKKA
jgi:hypothetical protein